ncbi:MAG: diacylglycerol/lipid kinase family protein [Candidatus Bipolaricaulia bacterium]
MDRQPVFLLVNPIAGKGRTRRLFPRIQRALSDRGIRFEYRWTTGPGEATELARDAVGGGFERIVAVGGDGTIHEVVNGILEREKEKEKERETALGVIPTGSGNDFVKSAGIPTDPFRALALVESGIVTRIDVGRIGNRYFANGLGIGLDGAVAAQMRNMRLLRGEIAYLYATVRQVLTFKNFPIKIETPEWSYQGRSLLLGLSNGRYHGGDFKLCPQAASDDGLLDLYVFEDLPVIQRLCQIPKVRVGEHMTLEVFHLHKTPKARISSPKPLIAHMDGEPMRLSGEAFEVEAVPEAIRVITERSRSS